MYVVNYLMKDGVIENKIYRYTFFWDQLNARVY